MTAGTLANVRAYLRSALSGAVRFLHHVEGDRLEALWLVDAVYGMRRGELLGMAWDGVDLDAGRKTVAQPRDIRDPRRGGDA